MDLNDITYRSSGISQRSTGTGDDLAYQSAGGASLHATNPTVRTSMGDSAYVSRRVTEISNIESVDADETGESDKPANKDTPLKKEAPPITPNSVPPTEATNQMTGIIRPTTGSTPNHTPPLLTPSHQPRFASDEPRSKYRWSPRMGDQVN